MNNIYIFQKLFLCFDFGESVFYPTQIYLVLRYFIYCERSIIYINKDTKIQVVFNIVFHNSYPPYSICITTRSVPRLSDRLLRAGVIFRLPAGGVLPRSLHLIEQRSHIRVSTFCSSLGTQFSE